MARSRIWGVGAVLVVAALLGGCSAKPRTTTTTPTGPVSQWQVNPRTTDPAITNDAVLTHLAFAPTGVARSKLVVVFNGSGSNPTAYRELAGALQADGYHVIVLRYASAFSTLSACPDAGAAADPDCHRSFRSEVTFGAGVVDPDGNAHDHPLVNVTAANAVVNRLLKLVEYLRATAPGAGWGNFQARSLGVCETVNPASGACDLLWSDVSSLGHSQGAGVALYLGKFFPLAKVGMLSGSYDGYDLGGGVHVVAPWITEGGLDVANADIGNLLHTSDYGLGLFRAVADALLVPGPETSVIAAAPPYGGSRRLVTSGASTCPWDATPGHNSTAMDACTPNGQYAAAWTYLAGS